ncbi:MAG: HAD family phosphatase [Phycisphaerae bacterium]|nr:HAD family phosphatase [Phycisphaerae bacterium]
MTDTGTQPDIRAVIFDLGGGVLVNMDSAPLKEKLYVNLNPDEIGEPERHFLRNPIMVSFNRGQTTPEEFFRRTCERYRLDLDFETFKDLWCDMFWTMDGMEELVGRVSKKATIGLLSDTDPLHWNYIRTTWPWINRIKKPTLSFEVGVMKPDAAIYLAASENVRTPPPQCLFIDDLQANVDGARAAGMRAIRFENRDSLARDLAISGLLELAGHQGA